MATKPVPAEDVPTSETKTNYPKPFSTLVEGRIKRKPGNFFDLTNFGVNLTKLSPGAISALFHQHAKQDEFIYILKGNLTLLFGVEEFSLIPGNCIGFKAGSDIAHQLVNRSTEMASYIEVGDRTAGDKVEYPNDDIQAAFDESGVWIFTHKDGGPY